MPSSCPPIYQAETTVTACLGSETVNEDLQASDFVGLGLCLGCQLRIPLLALLEEPLVTSSEVMQLLTPNLESKHDFGIREWYYAKYSCFMAYILQTNTNLQVARINRYFILRSLLREGFLPAYARSFHLPVSLNATPLCVSLSSPHRCGHRRPLAAARRGKRLQTSQWNS